MTHDSRMAPARSHAHLESPDTNSVALVFSRLIFTASCSMEIGNGPSLIARLSTGLSAYKLKSHFLQLLSRVRSIDNIAISDFPEERTRTGQLFTLTPVQPMGRRGISLSVFASKSSMPRRIWQDRS